MTNNGVFGINEEKIMFVVNQIYKSCESLNNVKLNLDEEIQDFQRIYGESFDRKFNDSLNDLTYKCDIVIKNILTFAEDFSKIRARVRNADEELQLQIKRDTTKFESENYVENYK